MRVQYHISHSLGFHTSGHAARRSRSFDFAFVAFCNIPDGVVRVAVDPEIVPADVGEFLEIRFEYPGFV